MLKSSLLCLALAVSLPYNAESSGKPWPMPQNYTSTQTALTLSPSFQFVVTGTDCMTLRTALNRYAKIIMYHGRDKRAAEKTNRPGVLTFNDGATLTEMNVKLTGECEEWPSLGMDEAYDLSISGFGGTLSSKSIWGILRGLETFSQIIYHGPTGSKQVNVTVISDFPRFSHRGVMLDTSRHFYPKEVLLANLDAMAYNKFNVFHWHIVDDQSFPYQSASFPEMSQKGAYDPVTHVYTQHDIAEILEHARLRGIRVIPEFDSPGHSQSWGLGQPGLLTPCYDSKGQPTGAYGPIDPSTNTTYDFLKEFMKELTTVFKDHYLHLGGDEVSFACWQSNPNIQKFMKSMGFGTDYSKLESYYVQSLLNIVNMYKAGYVVWQEVFDNQVKIKSDTVVHVWKGNYQNEMSSVTKAGYHALLSSPWYLNYISYGADWQTYYKVEPLNFTGSDEQKKLVLGGEACLWGEYVDGSNALSRLWPRAAAVAERLWSPMVMPNPDAAERMDEHHCRLVGRGIPAEPPNGPGFCRHEYETFP